MTRFVFEEDLGKDFLTEIVPDAAPAAPRFVFDDTPESPVSATMAPQNNSFLSEMGDNFSHGIQSAGDLLTGNFQDINGRNYAPTPKTTALTDKVFPPGYQGGFMDAANNALRNTSASDWSGALLEKFSESPEGKAMAALGGIHPVFNAAGTAINRYVNPAIQQVASEVDAFARTPEGMNLAAIPGAGPLMTAAGMLKDEDTLVLSEMLAGTAGLKKAGQIKDPLGSAMKSLKGEKAPTSAQVRAGASQVYQASEAAGGAWKPNITDTWINDASKVLPQTPAGKTVLGETAATKLVERMQNLRGKPLTLAEAQEIYSNLGDMAEGHVDPKTGKLLAEGKKFSDIQDSLWDTMENASPADIVGGKQGFDLWKQGKTEWSKSLRMNELERILVRGEGADNPATVYKNGFRALESNPKRFNRYSAAEKRVIKHAARTGAVTGLLKIAGSRLVPIIGGASGGGFTGAAVGYGVSEASRAAANALQRRRGQKALNKVAKGPKPKIPLNQQMKNNVKAITNNAQDAAFGAALTPDELRRVRP